MVIFIFNKKPYLIRIVDLLLGPLVDIPIIIVGV